MDMHSRKRKCWKRGISLLLAVLTVFNLSSQGLILTAAALGGKEVEAPEIGVTFAPEQLPGSMANQVSDRVYMLPTKAEMSLQLTVQPGYTKGYATGGYVRIELPYFYVDAKGELVVSDTKPSGIPEDQLMGVEAKVVGETGNWIVDTQQGEAAPVAQLVVPELPVEEIPQPELPPVEPLPEPEPKPEPAAPEVTQPEEVKPEAPTPEMELPETAEPMPDAVPPEAEVQGTDATQPEPQFKTPREAEATPVAPETVVPQLDAPVVQTAVDDGEGYRRGVLQIMAANDSVPLEPKPISFTVSLRFFGEVPENVTGSVRLGAGYAHYHDESGAVSQNGFTVVPGSASEKDIHQIEIVNSNLQWEYSIDQVGKSVLWDKYNYITYHVKVANTSGKDTTSKIDKFTMILRVQSQQNTPSEGGVLEEDMMQWEYNPDGDPIFNEDYSPNSRDKTFIGVPNQGGVLVHDVTDMTQEERENLDLEHFTNLGPTLPYHYSLPGVIGVNSQDGLGELVPEHMANGTDKRSYREYYISVPYTNNLRGSITTETFYRPTIYFGGRNVPWTKETKMTGEFIKRAPNFAHDKYVLGNDDAQLDEKPIGIGDTDAYYLGGFQNTGNVPAFRPVVTDSLPENYVEKRIDLMIDPDSEGNPRELTSCFTEKPIEFVFEDKEGKEHYVTTEELGVTPSSSVDPDTKIATYSYVVEDVVAKYLEHRDWTFTRKIRIHLIEEIEDGDLLPCRVVLTGKAPKCGTLVNTIDTDYITKYWQPKTESEAAHYEEEQKKVAPDTATLIPHASNPQIAGHGVLRGETEVVGPAGGYQEVPLAEPVSGLRYTLGNDSISPMVDAGLAIGPLLVQSKVGDEMKSTPFGFHANEVYFSPELWDHYATIKDVVLTDQDGKKVTISADEIQNHTILEAQWKAKDASFGMLNQIKINFVQFGKQVSFEQQAYVEVRGADMKAGDYAVQAEWRAGLACNEAGTVSMEAKAYLRTPYTAPLVEGHGVLRKDGAEVVAPTGEYQKVPFNVNAAGMRYVLANQSQSPMLPARLQIGPMLSQKDQLWEGFDCNEIRISKEVLKAGTLKDIVLTDENGKTVTLPVDALQKEANGDLRIPQEQWKKELDSFGLLWYAEFNFERFAGNVALDDQAAIDFNGTLTRRGRYDADATWRTLYGIPELVQEERYSYSDARLDAVLADPAVTATAHSGDKQGNKVDVLFKDQGYYEFVAENRSETALGNSEVTVDLQSVQDVDAEQSVRVQGFRAEQIVIGNTYTKAGEINRIEFYDWNQDPKTQEAKATIVKEELASYQDAEGKLVIPQKVFESLEYLKFIRVVFDDFYGNAIAPTAEHPEDTSFQIQVHGSANWLDTLTARGTLMSNEKFYTDADRAYGDAHFEVERPYQSIHSHIYYNNVEEELSARDENSDQDRASLGIPYDRDFVFRNELLNQSKYVLDDVDTVFTMPMAKGKDGGFHTTAIRLYRHLINNYAAFETVTLRDVDGKELVLTYDADAKEFKFGDEIVGTWADSYVQFDMAALQLASVEKVTLTGKGYAFTGDPAEEGMQFYVEFCGYEDAPIGSEEFQLAESIHYLDGERKVASFQLKKNDDALAYVSKMYFDTVITAGYNDNNPDKKFDAVTTALEDVREGDDDGYYSRDCTPQWGDNTELEIGYKALGSFMVDFRQYLNVGSNLPPDTYSQEHGGIPYVKLESLNTAAKLEVTVNLPHAYFDTYYLKVDPRAKEYLKSVTILRANGASEVVPADAMQWSAVETGANGAFCRLNLVKEDPATRFTAEESDYFKAPADYQADNPVKQVVLHLDINQKATHTDENGNPISNVPDYGTWYNETDESSKYMFEFTGRFYRMEAEPNHNGQVYATADTKMTIGGGRSQERVETSKGFDSKSDWSFKNYYPYRYYHSYYGCTTSPRLYKAGNLYSKTYVHVMRDHANVVKGATTSPTNQSNTSAYFGMDNQYQVSFYRSGTADPLYATTGVLPGKIWYDGGYHYHDPHLYQDSEDWSGKIGYADEIILRDTLPPLRPDDEYGFYGFMTTGLELKPDLAKYLTSIDLKVWDVDKEGQKTNPHTVTVDAAQLIEDQGTKILKFAYATEETEGKHPAPTVSEGTLTLAKGQFVESVDVHIKNLMGNGEYTKELGLKGTPDFHGNGTELDMIVHGKPYVIHVKDPERDGTNSITGINKVDYEDKEYTNSADDALLMGYLIPMIPGYRVEHTNPEQDMTDYGTDNVTPNVAEFGVELWNGRNEGSNEGVNKRARISKAMVNNTMNEAFRLQHIYIPKFFTESEWFRVKDLVLTINGKEHVVSLNPTDLKESAKYTDSYEIDVEQLIRDHLKDGYAVEYSNRETDFKTYLKASVSDFRLTFEAVHPSANDATTVLEHGEYLTADRQKGYAYRYDGIYVDRNKEEFKQNVWTEESTPSFGKTPDIGRTHVLPNTINPKFESVDVNADIYHNPVAPGTQSSDYYRMRNLAAVMGLHVTRDTATGFAYDAGKDNAQRQEVDQNHLLPYDTIEYTATIRNGDDADISLNNPTLHFMAPEGQQVVGWEFVRSTDAEIGANDLSGVLLDGTKELAALNGADYSLTQDGADAQHRVLNVTVNHRLAKNSEVVVRIKTQLLPEPADGYDNRSMTTNTWLTAAHTHSYPQYAIHGKANGELGYFTTTYDLGGGTSYARNVTGAADAAPEYELRATNNLTFFPNTNTMNVSYTFDDVGYRYDNQAATIRVTGIQNDTQHDLEHMVVTVSFLDEAGYQGFALTKVPDIRYPNTLPAEAGRAPVKIEYWCDETTGWVVGTGAETEEFLRTAKKVRWTYHQINAADTEGGMPQFDAVTLVGVGLYADIRADESKDTMAETYYFKGAAQLERIHHHQENKQIGETPVELEQDRIVNLKNETPFDLTIFRENPEVEYFTQVFPTEEAAANAGINPDAVQKRGYRPGETMWQKLSLRNLHMVDRYGSQERDQGVVLNPVFYDKLPEYLSSTDLEQNRFHVLWKDINGDVKNTDVALTAEVVDTIQEKDYGGAFVYPKSNAAMQTYYGRGFSDLTPSADNTKDIQFTVYKLSFHNADGSTVRMEVGDTIEIWYSVTARDDGLPMVYVDEDRDLATVNDQHPGYFPRMGEYYSHEDSFAHPLAPSLGSDARIDNAYRQMDLDYLLHDIGFTADKNAQVDRWEFLNGSRTLIPGSSSNDWNWRDDEYGRNGVLFDQDINEANDHQYVLYNGTRTLNNKQDRDKLPEDFTHTLDGYVRDWWNLVLKLRTRFDQHWDGTTTDRTPILWSQTRQHLQKAWLVTASEMVGSNVRYERSNPNYPSTGHWTNSLRAVTEDQNRTALEYDEQFHTYLHALNYGDWSLDGIEFLYIMPRGIEPQVKGGTYGITAQILSAVTGPGSEAYQDILPENVLVEVLQSPETGFKGYQAPEQVQDPLWTDSTQWSYYAGDGVETAPWVFKITVKQPLLKWFARGGETGYKIKVDIPSHVYLNNENEAWYDQVSIRPYVKPDSENHYYYQVMDIDHWEGHNRTSPHNQKYGMDYLWYVNQHYEYWYGSPNTPYIGGYNIQNNEVVKGDGEPMGRATENAYTDYATAAKLDLYAQTGTAAVMRKPLVRLWATTGDDLTGATQQGYYTDIEGQRNQFNIHVENKYWWDDFAFNGHYQYGYEKYLHNYETDGGSRGTLFAPVITNVLPFGITPVTTDGELFSTDNEANARRELAWNLYTRDVHVDADLRAFTEAEAAEKAKYDVKVTYEQIPCYDDAGEVVERTEGRYVVRIAPKQAPDGTAPEQEVRLESQNALTFSIMTFTEEAPRLDTDKAGIQEDLGKNYQDNRTYLSSTLPGFKAILDEDIAGNPYQVGAYAYSREYAQDIDPRLDAVKTKYHWGERGNLPDDRMNHTYEFDRPLLGGQHRVVETDPLNVEDYCAFEHVKKDLNYKALLNATQKDFNANGGNTHVDAYPDQTYPDTAIMNTLKIRTATPRLSVESLVGATKEEPGSTDGEVERPFQYAEDVWFSAKIQNAPSTPETYEEMGGVRHAKMVVSFHLPESVSYSGTAQWNVHNNDGDSYNNLDDYYLEYYDPITQQTQKLTQAEMRAAGWGVEVVDLDESEQWNTEAQTHGGQVVTFEITTPKTDGFGDYQSYIRGEKPAGYVPSGAVLNFKIRTRVDNLPKDVSVEESDVWKNGDHAEVYVTLHNTDGKFALRENGTFINADDYAAGQRPAAGAYNGFEVTYDGHDFHEQKQELVTWNTPTGQPISDERDDADALVVDYTKDGVYDTRHTTDESAALVLQKPHVTVRLDTGKLRPQVNDPDSDRVITEDPHVKGAYTMTMRLDQAVNEAANVNTFVVNYNIPYYGTNEGTPEPAPAVELNKLKQIVSKIRTGMWELPEGLDPARAAVMAEHTKVYVYVLRLEDPAAENAAYYYPGAGDYKMAENDKDNGWRLYGDPNGYALTDNTEIPVHPADQEHIYQIRWVIKTEPFTDAATGLTYSEEQAAIYYPVPAGFRLDVDADATAPGKQEMDDVDPNRVNKDEPTDNVKANAAIIEINTNKVDTEGVFKHTNHYATGFAKYDDVKWNLISARARAGYYVDPELPTVNLCIRPMYFSGNVVKGYKWKNDLNVDPQTSKMLKYRVGYENIGPEVENVSIDNVTDPTITIATPYVATLNENRFEYAPYQEYTPEEAAAKEYYIGDNYESKRNLDTVVPRWTWYLMDTDGTFKAPDDPAVVNQIHLEGEPEFVRKAIDGGTNLRTIANFHFTGYLKPGQTVYVDMMVPIEELEGNAVPVDMLQCKAFGFKKGNFDPYIQPGNAFDNLNYEYDTNDVNNNGNQKDMAITRLTNAIVFKSTESIVQNKSVTTELDSNVTGRAVPVPEGKDFEYKISIINKSGASEFNQLVLYDVLPYENDFNIKNLTSQGEKIARDSKWNGWLRPDSLRVLSYTTTADGQTEEEEVDPSQYEIWVGPIVQNGSSFEVKTISDLPTQQQLNTQEFFNQMCGNDAEKGKYFVRLSDVQAMADGAAKDEVVKGIRAVWVEMDESYTLSASARLHLSLKQHTPLNLPVFGGTLDTTPTNPNSPNHDYNEKVKDYTAWNTFVSRWNRDITEQARAGVYPNAPSGRGYIGSYVWHDLDYSGVPDGGEGDYTTEAKTGRIHLNQATVDLDFDGVPDDPGVNGVKVQLLNENGFLVNREGQTITQAEDGKYILIDPVTGEPSLVQNPDGVVVYQYSKYGGPVEYVTESDYYGREGYYILSNLLPGSYRLRFTFPEAYKTSSITTTQLGTDQATGITVYRDGQYVYGDKQTPVSDKNPMAPDRLIVQTDLIRVDAVNEKTEETFRAYDQKMTAYNVGVALGHFYGGTVWLDETDHDGHIESNGYLEETEPTLGKMEVTVYDASDLTKPCLDADNNPAVATTGDDGQYLFRLKPGRQYLVAVRDLDDQRLLKPTPWTFTNDPTEADGDNDLSDVGTGYQTKVFTAKVPLDASGKPIYQDEATHTYQAQTNLDLGLIQAGRGYLGKFVWDDRNYNGIMDADEQGIPGVVLTLESYYMDDQGQWVSLGERDVTTNAAGAYVFENVMSYHKIGDVRYLTGYKIRIDPAKNPGLYETYAITHYQVKGSPNSDLIAKPDSANRYYLNEDYIVVAIDANDQTAAGNRKSYGGKDYDISDAKIILDYDAGLTKYEYGEVSGKIWEDNGAGDHRYNGILDADESGRSGVRVYLEQYVKQADGSYQKVTDGVAADGTAYTDGMTVVTDGTGVYRFQSVPLFVRINGEAKLCYYRIRAELPDDSYAVTRYRQDATQTDSHWITDQYPGSEHYLTTPEEDYFLLAKQAGDLHNDPYVQPDGKTVYDMVHAIAPVQGYDGGILQYETAVLEGRVWDDVNYNGLQDPEEPGIQSQEVQLERYYYDGAQWQKDTGFGTSVWTTGDGNYVFRDLQTHVMVDGKPYLAGYRLQLKQLPEGYAVSRYRMGEDRSKDSDLLADTLALVREEEYLILAKEAVAGTDGAESYTVSEVHDAFHDGTRFDMLTAQNHAGQDGGIKKLAKEQITGRIWDDVDYNGIQNDNEPGITGQTIQLERFYYDNGHWTKDPNASVMTQTTGTDGWYTFADLTTYVMVDGKPYLAGYRLKLDQLPSQFAVTLYRQGDDRTVDSDLDRHELTLQREMEYLILADHATKNTEDGAYSFTAVTVNDAYHEGEVFDLVTSKPVEHQDGGMISDQAGMVTGILWEDANYNGIREESEPRIADADVKLSCFYYDAASKEWKPYSGAAERSVRTDRTGTYTFTGLASYANIDGQLRMLGYRVQAEAIPSGYDVTRYRVGDDRTVDSDLRYDNRELVRDGEYLILLEEATGTFSSNVTITDADGREVTYDLTTIKRQANGQDGGLVNHSQHSLTSLTGRIWDDQNYNGIQDAGEPGVMEVEVELNPYYYDGTQWQAVPSAGAPVTVKTKEDGEYRFDSLTSYVEVNGQKYLAGYRVSVADADVFASYDITYYRVGEDRSVDSDLRHDDHALVRPGEFLVLAQEAKTEGGALNHTAVTVKDDFHDGVTYDYLLAKSVSGQDGGLVDYSKHSLSSLTGRIWNDANYDGIQNSDEYGVAGVTVTLKIAYYDGAAWQDASVAPMTTETDAQGVYRFDNLTSYVEVNGQKYLAGYQVAVNDQTVTEYGITHYQVGKNKAVDSDLRHEDYGLVNPDQYLILAKEAKGSLTNHSMVTVNDAYHSGVTYDYLLAQNVSGQDGGLVKYSEHSIASLTGRIWHDSHYDGIEGAGETGIAGITVQLKTAYYDGTEWKSADAIAAPVTTVTGEDGVYRFENLPSYVQVGDRKYLAGYQVAVDETTVPDSYGITYYQVGKNQAVDSDLRYEDYALVQPGEYLILAQEAKQVSNHYNHTTVTVNDGYHNGMVFDYLMAQNVSGQDGGLVPFGRASLTGRIWEDANYDGLQNAAESGVEGVTVALKTSYYDGTAWQSADAFAAPATVETDKDGVYRFSSLPVYVEVNGQKYLAGYQVAVDDTTVSDTYGITYYQVGKDTTVDSDLRHEDYALVQPEEYLVLAAEAVQQPDGSYPYLAVTLSDAFHKGVVYDLLAGKDVSGQDGGLVRYGLASLTGRIWDDWNYNGIQDGSETGIGGVKVELVTSYYDGTAWQTADGIVAPATTETGEDGIYRFTQLPSYVQVGDQKYLAGYQVRVVDGKVFDHYGITYYQVGDDRTVDSDLRYEDHALVQPDEYLILALEAKAQDDQFNHTTVTVNDAFHNGVTYDYTTAHDVSGQDGGLVDYSQHSHAVLTGRIWEDLDYNGIQNGEEPGVSGVTVTLTTSYYDGAEWKAADDLVAPATTATGADGVYRFENLPSYVQVGDRKYLAGYQVSVVETTVPGEYGITHYQVGENKAVDSDLRYEDYALVQPGEYLIMAQEAKTEGGQLNHTAVTVNDAFHSGVTYDYLTAHDVSGQDGGLVKFGMASLTGRIWDDFNYNGIQDEEEIGIQDVTVLLKTSYYDGTEWQEADLFAAPATTQTDADGVYRFENLPSYVELDGQKYLAGYQVAADDTTLPERYGITYYQVGEDKAVDSDLRYEDYALVQPGEYLIMAQEAGVYPDGSYPYTSVTVHDAFHDGVTYDYLTAHDVSGQDGGLTKMEDASLSGRIWEDANYDGIEDDTESGVSDVEISLSRFYLVDGEWMLDEADAAKVNTDETGVYLFDHLPVFVEKEGVRYLAGYQVHVTTMAEDWAVTRYRQGINELLDSDLRPNGMLVRDGEVIPVARYSDPKLTNAPYTVTVTDLDGFTDTYDLLKGRHVEGQDGGITLFQLGSISGTVWNDKDLDGIINHGEDGMSGVRVELAQYIRKDGQWVRMEDFRAEQSTDADGFYRFDQLPVFVKETNADGEIVRYLTGYRLQLESLPENYKITAFRQNDGVDDSKVLADGLALIEPSRELDGCLVLAASAYPEISFLNAAEMAGGAFYQQENYDLTRAVDIDQMNAGLWKPSVQPKTGDEMNLVAMSGMMAASGLMFLMLVLRKRRKSER